MQARAINVSEVNVKCYILLLTEGKCEAGLSFLLPCVWVQTLVAWRATEPLLVLHREASVSPAGENRYVEYPVLLLLTREPREERRAKQEQK